METWTVTTEWIDKNGLSYNSPFLSIEKEISLHFFSFCTFCILFDAVSDDLPNQVVRDRLLERKLNRVFLYLYPWILSLKCVIVVGVG